MDYLTDVAARPEAFAALVIRVVFNESGALGMLFTLVVEPLFGDAKFADDDVRGDVVFRFHGRCRCWVVGGLHGLEETDRSEFAPDFFCDEVRYGVEFFLGHGCIPEGIFLPVLLIFI